MHYLIEAGAEVNARDEQGRPVAAPGESQREMKKVGKLWQKITILSQLNIPIYIYNIHL